MCFAPQRRALFRHLNLQNWSEPLLSFNILPSKFASSRNGVHFFDISTSKSGPRMVCFLHLTSNCASRHNGVHFFDISTSKSGPSMVCFLHFDLEMCFAPQRRALFRHLNFQKWSEPGVFSTFWLRNVFRATTAYTFSTSQLPKVVREWCVFYIWLRTVLRATTACNFSSLIWPTRRFSEPTFRPSGALEKHSVSRLSYLFAHLHLLSSDSFSSTLLSSNLSLLSASALLCFSSVHIVGSLASKLPSVILRLYPGGDTSQ